MTTRGQNRWRSFFASVCLLAIVLLYAPLAGASWSSYKAGCCHSDQCPIKEHHHQKSSASPENHMDCGHEMAGMTACTMSCCQNPDRPVTASALFVLPAAMPVSSPAALKLSIATVESGHSPWSIEPSSPPPRLAAAAA